jgi:uncharacterized protein YkwD
MLAACAGLAAMQAPGATTRAVADSGADQSLFAATNQDRSSNGLSPLGYYGTLQNIGESQPYSCSGITVDGRSVDMIQRNYFSHVIQGCGQYVFSMMNANGVSYQSAGENIGWSSGFGSASASVAYINNAFMNSSEHRANILDPNYTRMGVGSTWTAGPWSGAGGSYNNVSMFTELFVQQGSPPPPPPTAPPPAPPSQPPAAQTPPSPSVSYSHNGPVATPSFGAPIATAEPTAAATPVPSPEPMGPGARPGAGAGSGLPGAPGEGIAPLPLEQTPSGLLSDAVLAVLEGFLVD